MNLVWIAYDRDELQALLKLLQSAPQDPMHRTLVMKVKEALSPRFA